MTGPNVVLLLLLGCIVTQQSYAAGKTFYQGLVYDQPSYWDTNTKYLNLTVMKQDLPIIAAKGFDQIGFRIEMGDLMLTWDPASNTATYDHQYCAKLKQIAHLLQQFNIAWVFNVHLGEDVPKGFPQSKFHKGYNDTAGVWHPGVWRGPPDLFVGQGVKEPLRRFHTFFARCIAKSNNPVRYYKYSFESCYPSFPNAFASVPMTEKFRHWAKTNNSDLAHWNARWNETNKKWGDVRLPGYINKRWNPFWKHSGLPAVNSNKQKWGDFWRFYLLGVLKHGTYGVSIGDIAASLRIGMPTAKTAFKHYKPVPHWFNMTDLTIEELREAYDLPINATALGIYATKEKDVNEQYLTSYIKDVKELAPPQLPILIWETGASTLTVGQSGQYDWVSIVSKVSHAEGLEGYDVWNFIDWTAKEMKDYKHTSFHLGLHFRNGTKKLAWDFWPTKN